MTHTGLALAPTAEALLAILAELAGDGPPASPLETGRRVLRRAVAALGAAGGLATVVDSGGGSIELVAGEDTPAAAVELLAGGQAAWLGTAAEVRARTTAPHGAGAVAAVPVGDHAGGLALWFHQERAFSAIERHFLTTLSDLLARGVERAT